jgi:hypothetical protein
MSIIASSNSTSSFKPVPSGMHLARCYRVIDFGTQTSTYQGKTNHLHKVLVGFEVHGEDADGKPIRTDDGKPMIIAKQYTLSLNEKANLRADLASWRGRDFTPEEIRGFDLKNILGHWAMISVTASERDGREYTNISNVNPVPAQVKKAGLPEGENELVYWPITEGSLEELEKFGKGIQEKIKGSPEFQRRMNGAQEYAKATGGAFDDLEDDIPF